VAVFLCKPGKGCVGKRRKILFPKCVPQLSLHGKEVPVVLQGADYADDGSTKESKGSHEKGIYEYLFIDSPSGQLHAKEITCFPKK
jgi:hypothetical protein